MAQDNIKVTFVMRESDEHSEMQQAYEACKQNNIESRRCSEKECLDFESLKTDFFVFQEFKGDTFDKIRSSKSVRILGPWCLLTCLTEGRTIPNFPWPIYSVAMIDCTVAFSALSKQEKKVLQERVQFMGGYVSASLMGSCTHLVTNSVKSEKYIKAAEAGMKIMLPSWVNDVWESCLKGNVHCNNKRFNNHTCPVFYTLTICCTGLDTTQRERLRQSIQDNGGIYKEQLNVRKTDILVTENRTSSDKYKAALKFKIKCVTMQWVIDSVKHGYALPDHLYQVQVGTSTPTKDSEELPNFSMISNIGSTSEFGLRTGYDVSQIIDDTQISKISTVRPSTNLKRKSASNEHNELVDEINLKEVKSAGPFLDGCGIYLVGFGTEQRDKLCKIINFSGATRYNNISDRVTHIVAGDVSCPEFKYLRCRSGVITHPIVSLHWLLKSMAQQSPADEEKFIISKDECNDEPSSPLSKKSLHLLHAPATLEEQPECSSLSTADIVQQYFQPNSSSQEDTLARLLQDDINFKSKQNNSSFRESESTLVNNENGVNKDKTKSLIKPQSISVQKNESLSSAIDDDSSQQPDPIFQDLKFNIVGFTPDVGKEVKNAVESMAGTVVTTSYKGICDYVIVPTFSSNLKQVASNIVNELWIMECCQESVVRPIEYFHQPISVMEGIKPLEKCVVTISSYTNYERTFLKILIIELGGICQELLSRIDNKNGLLACTHLVSPEATGKKYAAAIKWGLPVLNKDWLMECARTSEYAAETPFLIGDAKPSLRSARSRPTCNASHSTNQPIVSERIDTSESSNEQKSTPKRHREQESTTTPVNRKLSIVSEDHTPNNKARYNSGITASQITPVKQIMAEARRQNLLGTPEQSLPRPLPWDHVDTPDTPLGAFIDPNPSAELRKEMVRYLNTFPDYRPRRNSTPLSELKRRLWDKICPPKDEKIVKNLNLNTSNQEERDNSCDNAENITPPNKGLSYPENVLNNQLKQLQEMLTASGGTRSNSRRSIQHIPAADMDMKDSQPKTVGWDDDIEDNKVDDKKRVFMFSGVDQAKRLTMIAELEKLGGTVIQSHNFDASSTHLICSTLYRNEKILASMSAGKWILHQSYVDQCVLEGKFVDEELYEFGNPNSLGNIQMENEKENDRLLAAHYWRKEVARRGYGAFHDMRLIVIAQKREPLIRILQAGGGMVIDESPPFTKSVYATHCLLELKSISNIDDYIPLAQQGIFCVNTLYVSDFLSKTETDVHDFIIPSLSEYYNS